MPSPGHASKQHPCCQACSCCRLCSHIRLHFDVAITLLELHAVVGQAKGLRAHYEACTRQTLSYGWDSSRLVDYTISALASTYGLPWFTRNLWRRSSSLSFANLIIFATPSTTDKCERWLDRSPGQVPPLQLPIERFPHPIPHPAQALGLRQIKVQILRTRNAKLCNRNPLVTDYSISMSMKEGCMWELQRDEMIPLRQFALALGPAHEPVMKQVIFWIGPSWFCEARPGL